LVLSQSRLVPLFRIVGSDSECVSIPVEQPTQYRTKSTDTALHKNFDQNNHHI
jgi:hypothetical protein